MDSIFILDELVLQLKGGVFLEPSFLQLCFPQDQLVQLLHFLVVQKIAHRHPLFVVLREQAELLRFQSFLHLLQSLHPLYFLLLLLLRLSLQSVEAVFSLREFGIHYLELLPSSLHLLLKHLLDLVSVLDHLLHVLPPHRQELLQGLVLLSVLRELLAHLLYVPLFLLVSPQQLDLLTLGHRRILLLRAGYFFPQSLVDSEEVLQGLLLLLDDLLEVSPLQFLHLHDVFVLPLDVLVQRLLFPQLFLRDFDLLLDLLDVEQSFPGPNDHVSVVLENCLHFLKLSLDDFLLLLQVFLSQIEIDVFALQMLHGGRQLGFGLRRLELHSDLLFVVEAQQFVDSALQLLVLLLLQLDVEHQLKCSDFPELVVSLVQVLFENLESFGNGGKLLLELAQNEPLQQHFVGQVVQLPLLGSLLEFLLESQESLFVSGQLVGQVLLLLLQLSDTLVFVHEIAKFNYSHGNHWLGNRLGVGLQVEEVVPQTNVGAPENEEVQIEEVVSHSLVEELELLQKVVLDSDVDDLQGVENHDHPSHLSDHEAPPELVEEGRNDEDEISGVRLRHSQVEQRVTHVLEEEGVNGLVPFLPKVPGRVAVPPGSVEFPVHEISQFGQDVEKYMEGDVEPAIPAHHDWKRQSHQQLKGVEVVFGATLRIAKDEVGFLQHRVDELDGNKQEQEAKEE